MRLKYGRTIVIGLAFMSICAFWQLYDSVVPLMLRDTFHLGDDVGGVIMALDNVLALFMLPLFGALSDRTRTRVGRRMPYIVCGTLAAAVLVYLIPFSDNRANLTLFMASLGLLLICMGTYRSPAVALMPDVTPKPLRSKANAIINLMGALGGIYSLIATKLLVHETPGVRTNYMAIFLAIGAFMLLAVAALFFFVRETKLAAEAAQFNDRLDKQNEDASGNLPPEMKRSLGFILASVALWFMGYNAVTTAFTKYATSQWGMTLSTASNCLLLATAAAVVSYVPIGFLASRLGRKKTIMGGIVLLCGCFLTGALAKGFSAGLYVMFALVGVAWAAINVNSYPMVVEISKGSDVGKYTGYYYTFSMSAQIATPIISGWLLEHVGYHTLFPYAAIMVALAFATMAVVRHGDSKAVLPATQLEMFDSPD